MKRFEEFKEFRSWPGALPRLRGRGVQEFGGSGVTKVQEHG
jgi:hypothetical protein